jgi:hypothetical protein
VDAQLPQERALTAKMQSMLRVFMAHLLARQTGVVVRTGDVGPDLRGENQAEEAAEEEALTAVELDPNVPMVVNPASGVCFVMTKPMPQMLTTNASMLFIAMQSIHSEQSYAAADVNLTQFFQQNPSMEWIASLGDQVTQQYDITAARNNKDLTDRHLFIVGAMHLLKMCGGYTANRAFEVGAYPLFGAVGFQTQGMVNFVIEGGNLRKLLRLLYDIHDGFSAGLTKYILFNDADFCAKCGADCQCHDALLVYRAFRQFSTDTALSMLDPFLVDFGALVVPPAAGPAVGALPVAPVAPVPAPVAAHPPVANPEFGMLMFVSFLLNAFFLC